MEDEDEIEQPGDSLPPVAEQPLAPPFEADESQVAEHCNKKSLPTANTMKDANEDNEEESKLEDAKVDDGSDVKMEELEMKREEVSEERENDRDNVQELKSEDAKLGIAGEEMIAVDAGAIETEEFQMKDEELLEEKAEIENDVEERLEVMVKEEEEKTEGKMDEEDDEGFKEEKELEEKKGKDELGMIEEMGEEVGGEEAAKEEGGGGEEAAKVEGGGDKEAAKEEEGGGEEVTKLEEGGGVEASKVEGLVGEEALKVEEVAGEVGGDEDMKEEEVVGGEEDGGDGDKKEEEVVGEEEGGGEEAEEEEEMEDSEANGDEDENAGQVGDEESSPIVGEDDEAVKEGETPNEDTEMETVSEVAKSSSGGKRRRGRGSKSITAAKAPARKTVGEDVCFICLDGGDLVLCDRRGCPKAYHPSCVDHDEDFFKTKGRWDCGWHLCNQCGKNAYFLCYTCTFSLCKGCSKDAVIFCVRGSKGFCESCMKSVMAIESNEQKEMGDGAFDDKSSWEYLFKDYWIEQKAKLCITSDELARAKNLRRDSDASRRQKPVELHEGNNGKGTDSDNTLANLEEVTDSKRKRAKRKSKPVDSGTDSSSDKEAGTAKRKSKRKLKSQAKETYSDSEHSSGNQVASNKRGKRGRRLSKSHLKGGNSGTAAAAAAISAEGNIEWASQELLEFVMQMKSGDRSVLTQFDVQELLLEYIKRNKLRDPRRQSQIICDSMLQKIFGKARVGHFEMLKLLESHFLLKEDPHADDNQGSVVDTEISPDDQTDSLPDSGKSRGKKSRKRADDRGQSNLDDYAAIDRHNISLIYLRRALMESLMDDTEMFHDKVVGSFVRIRISASSQKQDIYRLVQIIGTSKTPEAYKVGKRTTEVMLEILNLDKTEIVSIDSISNQEFTEDECKRLRQSIKCGLISRLTVGDVLEKAKELQEARVVDWLEAEIVRLSHLRDRASEKGRKKELRECVEKLQLLKTPEERQRRLNETPVVHADPKMDPSCESDDENEMHDKRRASNVRSQESGFFRRGRDHFSSRKGAISSDSWSGNARPPNRPSELGRNLSNKGFSSRREDTPIASHTSDHTWNNGAEKGTPRSNSWEKPRIAPDTLVSTPIQHSGMRPESSGVVASQPTLPLSTPVRQVDEKVNETEKMWHYRDPTGKVQGPFSMAQLRKWSNTGYFPVDLRIWTTSQSEDDSILLTEALAGRFQESRSIGSNSDVGSKIRNTQPTMDTSKLSGGRHESSNLPSPTPARSPAAWSGKQTSNSFQSTNQFRGSERLPSPTPTSPISDPSGVDRSNFSPQIIGNVAGRKQENVAASVGPVQPAPVQFVSNPGMVNAQQMSSQPGLHVANQPFVPPDTGMNQINAGLNASGAVLGFSNMVQPGAAQNPSVYTHNWGAGYVSRPEMVNANLTPNNQNAMQPAQVAYSQWNSAGNNQATQYAAGYPQGQGNIAANFPAMPMNTAWGPAQANMPWVGQQQQPLSQNVGWNGPPAGPMAQLASPSPGAPAMGCTGTGPGPAPGNTNMVWVGAPGSTGTWAGDQNRNGGGAQYNRQPSFGNGGQRVCKYYHENGHCRKGSSCDYMHS